MKFKDLIKRHNGKDFLIIGAGNTVLYNISKIKFFIDKNDLICIGCNFTYTEFKLDYHIWTNNGRIKEANENNLVQLNNEIVLFGERVKSDNILKSNAKKFIIVPYNDKEGEKIEFDGTRIKGFYRTSGNLSIMISHLLGAKNIYIVGMDGHSFHYKGCQHWYSSKEYTDGRGFNYCRDLDNKVYECLNNLHKYGINFKILTPTYFEKYYKKEILNGCID